MRNGREDPGGVQGAAVGWRGNVTGIHIHIPATHDKIMACDPYDQADPPAVKRGCIRGKWVGDGQGAKTSRLSLEG